MVTVSAQADSVGHLKADVRRHGIAADITLPLAPGRVTVLFGPSGAGKSTVLRTIAGLAHTEGGRVEWSSGLDQTPEVWDDGRRRRWHPRKRRVGLLFQDHALFPHMSVTANVGYGLVGVSGDERSRRVHEALLATQADSLAQRSRADSLSGGEAQRVALARALAPSPRLLLLDEPLSALDAPTRRRLGSELRDILVSLQMPTVLVTHDRAEALSMGDDAIILIDGRVRQLGRAAEVFDRPADADVAGVVGVETALPAIVQQSQHGLAVVQLGRHQLTGVPDRDCRLGQSVIVCIRSEDVSLEVGGPRSGTSLRNHLDAKVMSVRDEGALVRVELDVGVPLASTITRTAAGELGLVPGLPVTAVVKSTSVHLIVR